MKNTKNTNSVFKTSGSYVWKNESGWCVITWSERGITELNFGLSRKGTARQMAGAAETNDGGAPAEILTTVDELDRYFAGEKVKFSAPLDFGLSTTFQKDVWKAALKISYGKSASYREIAEAAGSPQGARAAGSALGANRIPIIIPCHRVLHADGGVGGYALGTEVKKGLLKLEGIEYLTRLSGKSYE